MKTSLNITDILIEAYNKYSQLSIGGKLVACPYRINDIGSFQKVGPEFQGKSSPEVIIKATKKLAKEQNFNLEKASIEQIRSFMEKNKLGIDCSGFSYRALNHLAHKLGLGSLEQAAGMEHVGRTGVAKLTSKQFSIPIKRVSDIKAGDIIRVHSGEEDKHCILVVEVTKDKIVYAHSSIFTDFKGIHLGEIKITDPNIELDKQEWTEKVLLRNWDDSLGDGAYRLKILENVSRN